MEKYLTSIIEDSVIRCDETIEETIAVPTNFNEKKTTKVACKTKNCTCIFINYSSIIDIY